MNPTTPFNVLDEATYQHQTQIVVSGTPAPQGSKKYVGHHFNARLGKLIPTLVESSHIKVKDWRIQVAAATHQFLARHHDTITISNGILFDGAIGVGITFIIPKPKSAPKKRPILPTKKPDVDKLLRATLDGLGTPSIVGHKLWKDDSYVTDVLRMGKRYTRPDLPLGAVIDIYTVTL